MKKYFLNAFSFLLLLPLLSWSNNLPTTEESITFTLNSEGEIIDLSAPTSWTNGALNSFYLDFAHTQKTFKNIRLKPGDYRYTLKTVKRNNKKGKVNFWIKPKYKGKIDQPNLVFKQFAPGRTDSGNFSIDDFHSKSNSSAAGYAKLNVHIGRVNANTNVNYKITLTKVGGGNCSYTSLGSKSGNVVGNTRGKFVSTKKACKNTASVTVTKTGGKARTTITVYATSTKNGQGTLKASDEFAAGSGGSPKTFNISGVNGKFIRVELKNRSATKTFKWRVTATQ